MNNQKYSLENIKALMQHDQVYASKLILNAAGSLSSEYEDRALLLQLFYILIVSGIIFSILA